MSARAPTAPAVPRRHPAIDGLRALALLPVVVVNFAGYATLPWSGPLAEPAPSEGLSAWVATVLVLALLQGKGIVLLMFLFGYGLALGGAARVRLRWLTGIGLAHGALLYCGDIVSQYALVGLWLRSRVTARLRRLRRIVRWGLWGGGAWLVVQALASWWWPTAPDDGSGALAPLASAGAWWQANALAFAFWLPTAMLGLGPWLLGVVALGSLAGRLRWLHHPRWRGAWAGCARWAGPVLALNLAFAVARAEQLVGQAEPVSSMVHMALGWAAVATWVPWLLLHALWPAWLVAAGRQTLSLYLACSLVTVAAWCGWALGWRPGVVPAVLAAVALWAALVALAAWAARHGVRLPAEAWLAHRGRQRPRIAGAA